MFIIQIIVSFIIGGLVIAGQTLLAERVPDRWRGAVLTLPTTLPLGLFFIGFVNGSSALPEAVLVIPTALGIDYLFVLSFAFFSRFTLAAALIGGYGLWTLAAVMLLAALPKIDLWSSVLLYCIPLTMLSYFAVKKLRVSASFSPAPFRWKHLALRSLFAGSVIALSVVLAKTMGNTWGGLFTLFPAAFTATFLIYYFVHGKSVIPTVAASLFFPGAVGILLYALVAAWFFPKYGIWMGTLLSYTVTLPIYGLYALATYAGVRQIFPKLKLGS